MSRKNIDLSIYSKAELLQAIDYAEKTYYGCSDIKYYLNKTLKRNVFESVCEQANKARQNAINKMNDYYNWQKEMIKKYGDGIGVSWANCPREELQKGTRLYEIFEKADEERREIEKREDKIFKQQYGE